MTSKFAKSSVSRHMRERGKNLRNQSTPTEIMLWQHLKNSQTGLKFRRQQPMGSYVVDFYCSSQKLVIEIDGSSHEFDSVYQRDQLKQTYLQKNGYTVFG